MYDLDVVEHKVEVRSRPWFGRLLGLSYHQMGAAAQFKYCEIAACYDRAQSNRRKPARGSLNIGDVEAHVTNRSRRSLIGGWHRSSMTFQQAPRRRVCAL